MYSSFKDNIWGVDLADMQLIIKYNKGIRYLLCAKDLYTNYAFVVPLKDKKGTIKIWTDQGSESYNKLFKKWLKDNRNVFNT